MSEAITEDHLTTGGERHLHQSGMFQVGQETVPRTWHHKKFLTSP